VSFVRSNEYRHLSHAIWFKLPSGWPSHIGESVGYLTIINFELGSGYNIASPPTKLCPSNTTCRIYSDMNTLGRLLKSCDPITITDEVRSLSANLSTGIILIASVLLVLM
jgi:hypothetical protein